MIVNRLPNVLTALRIFLSTIYFIILVVIAKIGSGQGFGRHDVYLLGGVALIFLVISIITDFLDGFLARRWELTSDLGRLIDPLADKILICGSFIMFLEVPRVQEFLSAWMVLVVVGRELMVQGMRVHFEQKGVDFGASFWGKFKMVVQSTCAIYLLSYPLLLAEFQLLETIGQGLVWLMVLSTVASGASYVDQAIRLSEES